MEKEGYVSLWTGNSKSYEKLMQYVDYIYDEDGDCFSVFANDFQIEDFDEDFTEKIYFDKNINTLKHLLTGCSYEDIVIPAFEKSISENLNTGFNSAILLYNFKYDKNIKIANNKDCMFKFIGFVKYIN